MAGVIFAKSKEKPAVRVGIPDKGFDVGVRKYNTCPSDQSDLHGLLCRKTLKDIYTCGFASRIRTNLIDHFNQIKGF
jgi:hypothetical protein